MQKKVSTLTNNYSEMFALRVIKNKDAEKYFLFFCDYPKVLVLYDFSTFLRKPYVAQKVIRI